MAEPHTEQILVVDDDVGFRTLTQQFLLKLDYASEIAASAPEALEILKKRHFDLVLSDIRMKEKDGVQLMKEAKEIYPHLDFIMMTGFSSEYSYSDVIQAGAADYIRKPFEMGEIKAKLERIGREKNLLWDLQQINRQLTRSFTHLRRTMEGIVTAMGLTLEMRDPYTAGHQRRVAGLACAIAKEMGLDGDRIEGIRMAGLIHDLGKIQVPSEILCKPSRLTDFEFGIIKLHPAAGHHILKTIYFTRPIAEIVLQHHEKMNGSGYPQGLRGQDILLEARILAVADVVEAMASHRPYRPALGLDQALEEIHINRGVLFDPDVVDACLKLFKEKNYTLET
ncbi:MAG: HD domain-containing phosphohydrolase [Syntrophobacteraceae bacterium]